jgi:hypothetical protein
MQDKEDGHVFCLKNLFSIYQKMSSTEKDIYLEIYDRSTLKQETNREMERER